MTFNPSTIGITTEVNRTSFYFSQGIITGYTHGFPYPVLTNSIGFPKVEYEYSFISRLGLNTQNIQPVSTQLLGMLSNGILISPIGSSKIIPNTSVTSPNNLSFCPGFFPEYFTIDSSHGKNVDDYYRYTDGAFLLNGWISKELHKYNSYYSSTSYQNDYFRHPDGHSKILGYSFDGYPIYGPYGYKNSTVPANGTKLMKSSYSTLLTDSHRPAGYKYTDKKDAISFTAGAFIEDYIYLKLSGDLDQHNGRYTQTPDFPNGTYAYFLTFETTELIKPAYPYIIGPTSKQQNTFVTRPSDIKNYTITSLWQASNNTRLGILDERRLTNVVLPLANGISATTKLISGSLPKGLRLENNQIVGLPFEVTRDTLSIFVIRATYFDIIEDRTFELLVRGQDEPQWQTLSGFLSNGYSDRLFILDNEIIDYQLIATDSDTAANQKLMYFISEGDGELPPGITLTPDGKLQGIVEPLLSLDKRFVGGGYDTVPFGAYPMDFSIIASSGYGSYYYDTASYGFNNTELPPTKLNRYYPFTVTVSDGETFVKRDFMIYVVGDDYLTADNTITHISNGVFTADNTNVRKPVWITPSDLGFKRANNNVYIPLDVIDNPTLSGVVVYTLEDYNNDGSLSKLPPNLQLDNNTGDIAGFIPYMPAITKSYKFTVTATRIIANTDQISIYGRVYEDVMLGNTSLKIYKLNLSTEDNIDDLSSLVGKKIVLDKYQYTVKTVDDSNIEYDIITLKESLIAAIDLNLSKTALIDDNVIFINRLTESEKSQYLQHQLRFSSTEYYTIKNFVPYLQYNVFNSSILYPSSIRLQPVLNKTYFINDYIVGPDLGVYQCNVEHTYTSFISTNWIKISDLLEQLTLQQRLDILKKMLHIEYNYQAYIEVINDFEYILTIPSTAYSRIKTNIEQFFNNNFLISDIKIIRDNEDALILDKHLVRQLNQGRNIGISLFKNTAFYKEFFISNVDEVLMPKSSRTFDLRIIGEIDSNIKWLTPSNLGTIVADYICTLRVVAETNVPDSNIIYTIVNGKLPPGLSLAYNGEIIGTPAKFDINNQLGMTYFDTNQTSWDKNNTSFDKEFRFTIRAQDRFNISTVEREFILTIDNTNLNSYTDVYIRPLLPLKQRLYYQNFISDTSIFIPAGIYRPQDPNFGLQYNLDMLIYSGIEAKKIEEFVAATAKNHKRKSYVLGSFKSAIAMLPSTRDIIYEVIYIEVIDPAMSIKGKTRSSFNITTKNKITVDSLQYESMDDCTKTGSGYKHIKVSKRFISVQSVTFQDYLLVDSRNGSVKISITNSLLVSKRVSTIKIPIIIPDTDYYKIRPTTNTIKTDTNAIRVSDSKDQVRYLSNIENMRDNIKQVGMKERNYLPLWMRTPQSGFQELDYQMAIPVCFCKQGYSEEILRNIKNSKFDTKQINYDIDRYIIKHTEETQDEQYIVFANYQFNV